MIKEIYLIQDNHLLTKRNYIERMINDKIKCMSEARKFEKNFWDLVGKFSEHGFNVDLYSKISDFTDTIAAVPCSAKEGEGIQEKICLSS